MRRIALLLLLLATAPAAAQSVCPTPPTPGREQSPVDIRRATATRLTRLVTRYPTVQGRLLNDGHRVQVDVDSGSVTVDDSVRFDLKEFHFHWPAEHELIGGRPAAEIHMVHKTAGGRIAVVGTWIRAGAHNHAWDAIWARLPSSGDPPAAVTVRIARLFGFTDLNTERVYRYCGSLTTGATEPYTEGVTWLMRRTPITMSRAQLDKLHRVMHRYSRDVQPLHDRQIRYRRGGP
ncbi:MAG TPA: carbonic anhydrase family protein [Longimicrobiaceae bacterium]|nr:carbonic anhydrase family protein [Longimicrobiaceae bacterium]